jgi:hypothetical protein
MANLDWVLMSPEWTQHFPLCSVASLVRIGSDHAPLILNIEEESVAGGGGHISPLRNNGCWNLLSRDRCI